MYNKYCTIVSGKEVLKADLTEKALLEFLHFSQNEVATITMYVPYYYSRSPTGIKYPAYI